jgi:uncharacterized protein YecT (DUF1311 family)
MRVLSCLAALLGAAILPSFVVAQELDCEKALAQQDMNRCAYQSYLKADQALNAAYKQALAKARAMDESYLREGDEPVATILRDAQRAWIPYRDKACELESTIVRGGSLQPLFYTTCLENETRARTKALLYFAEPE